MLTDSASVEQQEQKPTPRLIIDRIVVDNFKSYLGRHTLGPFHRSFSAIVGPNGSGKSNVIDALMFVLGSRAKRLRQGKLGELVHQSEGADNIESCTVEIMFAECVDVEGGLPQVIQGSEFTVSRTAWRNSRNQYAINGQVCQQQDVYTLLKGHGVDLDHKRFLILQGEVELIAQMKPKGANEHEEGLLEYLEDIIGTAHYAEKIDECGKSVDSANTNCSERLLRARHCEKELTAMSEEKETAELYLKLENQVNEKKSELFQVKKYQLEKQWNKANDALTTATNALAREQEKNAHQLSAVEQIESELKERNNAYSAVEREANELMKRMKRLENEDVSLREKKAHLKKKLANLGKSGAEADRKKGEVERELSNLAVERDRLDKQIADFVVAIEQNENELRTIQEGLAGKTDSLQQELALQQTKLQPFKEAVRRAQAELDICQSALNEYQARQQSDGDELERITTSINVAERELAEAQESSAALLQQQKALQKQSVKFMEQRQMAEAKLEQVVKDLSVLQSTISEAKDSQSQNNTNYRNQAVSALMKDAKRIGGGIYGRLGDLGVIEGRYDVAVSTAAPQLHYMVVDTTDTAQRCVEYLRKNNLGRASFIILDKMRPKTNNQDSLPKGAERLIDLITAKESKFEPAFSFAVGDTLVADTMELASRVAFDGPKRHRVVTLDGKLIDTSGTMSGGGKQVSRGAMRIKNTNQRQQFEDQNDNTVSEEQIAELQSMLEQKQEEQRILRAMISEFQQSLQAIGKELKRAELDLAKAEQVIRSLPIQLADLNSQRDDLVLKLKEGKSRQQDQQLITLIDQVSKCKEQLSLAQSALSPHQSKLCAIEDKIMDAGGIRYKVQKAKLDGMREQLALFEGRLNKVTAEMTVLGGGAVEGLSREQQGKLKQEEEVILKEIAGLDTNLETNCEQAVTVKTRLDSLQSNLEEQKEAIAVLKKTLEQHNRTLSKFRKHEFDLKMKVEELERECGELTVEIERYKQAISGLRKGLELNSDDLDSYTKRDVESIQQEIASLEAKLANIPNPNIAILAEWTRQQAIFQELDRELKAAEEHRTAIRAQFDALRRSRHDEFMSGLRTISHHLKQLYQLLTMGGNAELELVDSLDPFTEGVQFSVMPPKKSWKAISNLSGGEKTLASLSLIFALHAYKPTPIYVMDEIDAALDFRNVSIVGNYIKERCRGAQFVVISLRNDMFELADRLIGVYKVEQRTQSVCIDPRQFHINCQ